MDNKRYSREQRALIDAINTIGGQVMLARKERVSQSAVSHWVTRSLPKRRVARVAKLAGVDPRRLNEDYCPDDPAFKPARKQRRRGRPLPRGHRHANDRPQP